MTIESANYVSDLNTAYPAAGDARSEGDDHLRLLKTVIKNSFPAFSTRAFTYSGGWSGTHTPAHLTGNSVIYGFSGNGTIALTAAATVGNGFVIGVYAPSGVTVIIDPDGSETVNGSGSISVTGQVCLLFCTGAGWLALYQATADPRMIAEMVAFAGATLPSGWLWCDGSAISRSTYAALFSAISTTYGSGDGSTTFNLPDLRGRLPLGQDDMDNSVGTGGGAASRVTSGVSGVDGATLGATGGAQSVTLDTTMIPSHNHGGTASVTGTAASNGAHTHTVPTAPTNDGEGTVGAQIQQSLSPGTLTSSSDGAHTHTISGSATITAQGGGAAHNNMPPVQVVNYIIKAF